MFSNEHAVFFMKEIEKLLSEIRSCDICQDHLPLGPRPIIQVSQSAKILIVGQAPGIRVHETGIAFNDPSGDRLQDWLGVGRELFYDEKKLRLYLWGFVILGQVSRAI